MTAGNPYNDRFRWWYESIADLQLSRPNMTQGEIAAELGKHQNTISQILNSDSYRLYFSQRRQRFSAVHDDKIARGLTAVAEKAVELLLSTMEEKKTQLGAETTMRIAESALTKLGYGVPNSPLVSVNNVDNRQVTVSVSREELLGAQQKLRSVEQMRLVEGPRVQLLPPEKEGGSGLSGELKEVFDVFDTDSQPA